MLFPDKILLQIYQKLTCSISRRIDESGQSEREIRRASWFVVYQIYQKLTCSLFRRIDESGQSERKSCRASFSLHAQGNPKGSDGPDRCKQGINIGRIDIRQDGFMTGGYDQARRKQSLQPPDFIRHFCRLAKDQQILCIDTAAE